MIRKSELLGLWYQMDDNLTEIGMKVKELEKRVKKLEGKKEKKSAIKK